MQTIKTQWKNLTVQLISMPCPASRIRLKEKRKYGLNFFFSDELNFLLSNYIWDESVCFRFKYFSMD